MKNTNYLPSQFTGIGEVKGFNFLKLYTSDHAYMYEVTPEEGVNPYFEVFSRKTTPICLDFTKRLYSDTECKEVYPKGEAFGNWAWTTPSIKKACVYFNDIGKKQIAKLTPT